MTLFPLGTFLRLFRLARVGSRQAWLYLAAWTLGTGLIVLGALVNSTAVIVIGTVLLVVGLLGSRAGAPFV